ncbi:MAG TPA: PaaI family thioesterase [Ilumatobacter sp.]
MTPTETVQSTMPLCATLGITASEFAPDRVILHLDWQAALCTSAGLLHGGVLMALSDSAGAASAFLNLPEGASGTSTIESKTNFLGGVREGASVTATATPLHRGATTIVVETELRTAEGKLVAKTTQTQAVLRPRG